MMQHYNFGTSTYVLIIVITFALKMSALNCDLTLQNNTQGLLAARLSRAVRTNWNRIMSPALVQQSLNIAVLGSTQGTKTETELRWATQVPGSNYMTGRMMSQFYFSTSPVNYLYIHKRLTLTDEFKAITVFTAEKNYVNLTQINKVSTKINDFLTRTTKNQFRIDQPVVINDDFHENSAMIALNVINHTADWLIPFNRLNDSTNIMETQGMFLYGRIEVLKATALVLPFQNCNYMMLLIFADEERSLIPLEKRLQSVDVTKIPSILRQADVKFSLRKFQFDTIHSVNTETLNRLGIHEATSERAEFGNFFNEEKRILLKELRQFSSINVNTQGVDFSSMTKVRYEVIPRYPHVSLPRIVDSTAGDGPFTDTEEFEGKDPFFYYIINGDYVLATGSTYNRR